MSQPASHPAETLTSPDLALCRWSVERFLGCSERYCQRGELHVPGSTLVTPCYEHPRCASCASLIQVGEYVARHFSPRWDRPTVPFYWCDAACFEVSRVDEDLEDLEELEWAFARLDAEELAR